MHPSRHLASMMGYTTCADNNMVVLAAAQGKRHQVVNIGLNVKMCAVVPVGVTVHQWAQSFGHKVCTHLRFLTRRHLKYRSFPCDS